MHRFPLECLVAALVAGCGSSGGSSTGVTGSAAAGGSSAAAGGSSSNAGGGSAAGAGQGGGDLGAGGASQAAGATGALSCAERTTMAHDTIGAADHAATADLHCVVDEDCALVDDTTECTFSCGVRVNTTGAGIVAAAVADVNAGTCPGFAAAGCAADIPHTCPEGLTGGLSACIDGQCTDFPPAAWTMLVLDEESGTAPVFSWPPTCSPGVACSVRTLTPDGSLAIADASGLRTTTVSADDFGAVDGVLRSLEFRSALAHQVITCGPPPGGHWLGLGVSWGGGGGAEYDVSGCVLAGSDANDPRTLYERLASY